MPGEREHFEDRNFEISPDVQGEIRPASEYFVHFCALTSRESDSSAATTQFNTTRPKTPQRFGGKIRTAAERHPCEREKLVRFKIWGESPRSAALGDFFKRVGFPFSSKLMAHEGFMYLFYVAMLRLNSILSSPLSAQLQGATRASKDCYFLHASTIPCVDTDE